MLFSLPSFAQSLAYLHTPSAGCGSLSNCFTNAYDLTDWLWGTRSPAPSATDPVTVIIGAGNHVGSIICDGQGYVTFRGDPAASPKPKLTGDDTNFVYPSAVRTDNCTDLAFENLTIESPPSSTSNLSTAVVWQGSGNSRWIDVDVSAVYIAWYDSACNTGSPTPTNASPPTGMHYVQGSTWTGGSLGWYGECATTLFFDSTISAVPGSGASLVGFHPLGANSTDRKAVVGVSSNFRAEIYLVDSVVTADKTGLSTTAKVAGLLAGGSANSHPEGSGDIEMFGGAIAVKGNANDISYGARGDKLTETTNPASIRIQGTQVSVQNGTAAASVVAGDAELERVDLAP